MRRLRGHARVRKRANRVTVASSIGEGDARGVQAGHVQHRGVGALAVQDDGRGEPLAHSAGLDPRAVHAGDDMGVGHHQAIGVDEIAALKALPGVADQSGDLHPALLHDSCRRGGHGAD